MFDKDPARGEHLLAGLMGIPASQYRALVLRDEAAGGPSRERSDGVLAWDGWDQSQQILMMIYNAVVQIGGGKKAKSAMLKHPASKRKKKFTTLELIERGTPIG